MNRFVNRTRWSDERRLTLLLFGFSFLILGVPRVYTQTAAHALFIAAHGAAAMPWAYLAEALCVPLAGALYIAATRRFGLQALLVGTLGVQVLVLLLLRGALALNVPMAAGAAMVYFEIEFVLSSLLLWGLAGQLMTLRQGKRQFGYVSAGEPVAVIACGLSTPTLLQWLSPADLLLLSAGGALWGIVLALSILRRHRPLAQSDDAETADRTVGAEPPWWRSRYIVCMVVLVAVGQLGYFLVDSAFYLEAGLRFADAADLASFLGMTSALMGAVSLVCGALVAPWLLRRFGVRGGMLALPLLLLAGALATVSTSVFGGPADLVFLLLVGNKVIDQSLRYTLDKTTFVTLLQPLQASQRLRVQAGLESVVEPLAGGIAALLLMGMLHALGFGALGITTAILVVAGAWASLVAVQYRSYLARLRAAVRGPGRAVPAGQPSGAQSSRTALITEIDLATQALAAWARLRDDDRPGLEVQRQLHADTVSTCVRNCFSHLAELVHDVDMHSAYAHYTQGGPERRSYVVELLDNLLEPALKCRLLPLLEPQGTAEQAERMQAQMRQLSA